ncbi:MAG: TIGR00725 family protein [archaeon]|nr:TIGR00725 family protein [Candidatus Micrarchaeota archaeon]
MRKKVIFVAGSAKNISKKVYEMAEEVGREIARNNCILICGGLSGVMEAVSKGCREEGGLSIGVIPSAEKSDANHFVDVVIATGIGFGRNFILAQSADAMIVVAGQIGTLIESSAGYYWKKPIIALKGSGGTAERIAGTYLDENKRIKILSAKTPKEAVKLALKK